MALVLIVEDEEQVQVLAEAIIEDMGHETLTAGTAEQARALMAERADIDLLLHRPRIAAGSGSRLAACEGHSAQKPGLPVLYTTGQGVTDGMRAMFCEPFGFLPRRIRPTISRPL